MSPSQDLHGYIAAFISCLAFGSFAVPIKGEAANRVDIDPLVMQSYKTGMCFLTSWFVLLFLKYGNDNDDDQDGFQFTPWGIAGGLFWIPGGTCGIYGVRKAGIAVSQGIWSCLRVVTGFAWGLFVFHEPVHSKLGATWAIVLMMVGLATMSYYAAPSSTSSSSLSNDGNDTTANNYHLLQENSTAEDGDQQQQQQLATATNDDSQQQQQQSSSQVETISSEPTGTNTSDDTIENGLSSSSLAEPLLPDNSQQEAQTNPTVQESSSSSSQQRRQWFGERQWGILGAIIDGAYGGTILVPMHFAKGKTGGLTYVISFAIGASIVLCCIWILRYLLLSFQQKSWKGGYDALPSFHFKTMWLPGGLAGLLWSIGNFTSILSVMFLGEGVGYSIVQAQLLVAGLWGVLWYREIRTFQSIVGWFLGAIFTVGGIIWLSREHQSG